MKRGASLASGAVVFLCALACGAPKPKPTATPEEQVQNSGGVKPEDRPREPTPEERAAEATAARARVVGSVERRYDEFTGVTAFVATIPTTTGVGRIGLVDVGSDQISMSLTSSAASWQFLRCHSLSILIDDTPVQLGEGEHHGDVTQHGVIEQVRYRIDRGIVVAMSNAGRLRGRLCTTVFDITPEQIALLREFVAAPTARDGGVVGAWWSTDGGR